MAKSKGNRPYHLTPSESAVMQILWNSKEPMTQLGIIDAAKINEALTWKERSIFSMLNALLEKGMIKEEGMVRSGKTYARTFVAAMTKAEYYAHMVSDALSPKEMVEFRRTLRALAKDESEAE